MTQQEAKAWDYSVKTTRQAFWKMVEKGEERHIIDSKMHDR